MCDFYLALVGAVGWELVPSIPPEFMLLPTWSFHEHLRDVFLDARHRDSHGHLVHVAA